MSTLRTYRLKVRLFGPTRVSFLAYSSALARKVKELLPKPSEPTASARPCTSRSTYSSIKGYWRGTPRSWVLTADTCCNSPQRHFFSHFDTCLWPSIAWRLQTCSDKCDLDLQLSRTIFVGIDKLANFNPLRKRGWPCTVSGKDGGFQFREFKTLCKIKKSGGKEKLTLEGICDFIFVTLEGFYCNYICLAPELLLNKEIIFGL